MLSLINVSIPDKNGLSVSRLQADFAAGGIHGLIAPDTGPLKHLLECIAGQRTIYSGSILFNGHPVTDQAAYADARHVMTAAPQLQPVGRRASTPRGTGIPPAGTAGIRLATLWPYTSKDILLLHHLIPAQLHGVGRDWPAGLRKLADRGKTILISSCHYAALRDTCDYIYLFDKKRFPIVVAKADFHQFDHYFGALFPL